MKCQECTDNESRKTKKNEILHPAYRLGQRKMIFWKIRFKIEAGPGPGRAGPKKQKKTKINQKRHKSQNGAFSFATLMLSLCLRTGPLACFAPGRAWPPPAGGQDRILSFSFSSSSFFFFSSSFFFLLLFSPSLFPGPFWPTCCSCHRFLGSVPRESLEREKAGQPSSENQICLWS